MKGIIAVSVILGLFLAACAPAAPQPAPPAAPPAEQVLLPAAAVAWAPAPASLPLGAQISLLEGKNLSLPGAPFAFRLRFPDGYEIKPHMHPAIEHVTVLSGTFHFGAGEAFDRAQAIAYPPGSYLAMPIGHAMYAWAEGETIIQVHGVGPWGVTYLNPADDPRKK